jgi:tungstate transport system substrate-binding protein
MDTTPRTPANKFLSEENLMNLNKIPILALALLFLFTLGFSACEPAATSTAAPLHPIATASPEVPVLLPTLIPPTAEPTATTPANPSMILATTTSTQDSGLLDVLIPDFEAKTGFSVKVVAVGSGAAMTLGQEGNADVLLVHSPAAEKTFMDEGYGSDRRLVMHNDFILVGASSDLAGIKTAMSAVEAFQKIASTSAEFISRGDKSGTNTAELKLWKSAKLDPAGTKAAWYIQSGQGMGATLTIASQKGAYTLSDRATFLANKANLSLDILCEGDNALLNVYHVIIVNHDKWPKSNLDGATAFANYIISPEIQTLIGNFGVDKYGQQLFIPDADKTDADLGLN